MIYQGYCISVRYTQQSSQVFTNRKSKPVSKSVVYIKESFFKNSSIHVILKTNLEKRTHERGQQCGNFRDWGDKKTK